MNPRQAARVLNIDSDASIGEAKVAYRQLALKLHPDRKGTNDDEKFREVHEAYMVLKKQHESLGSKEVEESIPRQEAHQKTYQTPHGKPPEQDWGKYTSEFEEENPNFWREYERKFWEEYERTVNANGQRGENEKVREPKNQPDLFVDVDPSLCIACQSCETIAPDVFRIDRHSNLNPKSKVINMKGAGLNKIMNAAETCPTKAIIVEDTDTKRRLYPL